MYKKEPTKILLYETNNADVIFFKLIISETKSNISYEAHKDILGAYEYIKGLDKLPNLIITCSTMLFQIGSNEVDRIKTDHSLRSIPMIILTESEDEIKHLIKESHPNLICINKPHSLEEAFDLVNKAKSFMISCKRQSVYEKIAVNS